MIFAGIALGIVALVLAVSYYVYRTAFYSPPGKRPQPDVPMVGAEYDAVKEHIQRVSGIMAQYPCQRVQIRGYDGTVLMGRYYHLADGAPVELLFHGYRSHPFRDCSGGHALSRKLGFNALVVDQRAHGESGSNTITFGIRERYDCKLWAEYCANRFGKDVPVILSGLSMGAATVLMASGLELPPNVVAIIADSPYSAPSAIIEKVCQDKHYPVALCRPCIALGARLFGGFRIHECSAEEAVRNAKVPILLIHGESDRLVPWEMSCRIADAAGSKAELQTFPGAGHGLCYITDPRRYERIVCEFLSRIPRLNGCISEEFIKSIFK